MNQPADQRPEFNRPFFDGTEAGSLDLRTAAKWTANERRAHRGEKQAYFFGSEIIKQILAQPGCVGLRIYYATDDKGVRHLLVVGADANKNDQLPPLDPPTPAPGSHLAANVLPVAPAAPQAQYTIAEMAIPCPNQCGGGNALNGNRS